VAREASGPLREGLKREEVLEEGDSTLDLGFEKIDNAIFAILWHLLFIIALEEVAMGRNDVIYGFVLNQHFLMMASTLQRSPIFEVLTHQIVYTHHDFTLEGHVEQFSPLDQESDVLLVLFWLPSVGDFLLLNLLQLNLFLRQILIKAAWGVYFFV